MWLFCNDTATTEIYTYGHTLSLHDALPISAPGKQRRRWGHDMPMISTIALACAGSAAAAVVARWIPKALVPALVFEIAFGIAMGPSGLALLAPGPTMDMLALIGFAVLMLVAGIESDSGMLLGRQRNRDRKRTRLNSSH